jgi:succinyl-CoA synthetase beta subunit
LAVILPLTWELWGILSKGLSMRLYEFEGKQLFKKAGLPVPESRLGKTPEDVFAAFEEMKTDVVLKSQVLTGGRGKAGGIKFASGANEARTVATESQLQTGGYRFRRRWGGY